MVNKAASSQVSSCMASQIWSGAWGINGTLAMVNDTGEESGASLMVDEGAGVLGGKSRGKIRMSARSRRKKTPISAIALSSVANG